MSPKISVFWANVFESFGRSVKWEKLSHTSYRQQKEDSHCTLFSETMFTSLGSNTRLVSALHLGKGGSSIVDIFELICDLRAKINKVRLWDESNQSWALFDGNFRRHAKVIISCN